MTMTLNGAAQTFTWIYRYPEACHSVYTVLYEHNNDADGLISYSSSLTQITYGSSTYRELSTVYTISDNNDASKARSRVISFWMKFTWPPATFPY